MKKPSVENCLPTTEDKHTRPTKKNFKRLSDVHLMSKYVIFTVFRLISATGKTVPRVSFLEGCAAVSHSLVKQEGHTVSLQNFSFLSSISFVCIIQHETKYFLCILI